MRIRLTHGADTCGEAPSWACAPAPCTLHGMAGAALPSDSFSACAEASVRGGVALPGAGAAAAAAAAWAASSSIPR